MPKRPRRPARKCIFCNKGGERGNPITDEHLWSGWMHSYLPKTEGEYKQEGYRNVSSITRSAISTRKVSQGAVYTRKFHIVCKKCNNGWMGDIEQAAKPILIPLMQGQPTTIFGEQLTILGKWICLKAMVIDSEINGAAVLEQADRTAFMSFGVLPNRFKIWIGFHDCFEWYTKLHHLFIRTQRSDEDVLPPRHNINTVAIGVGHIIILTFVDRTETKFDMDIAGPSRGTVPLLWPPTGVTIVWPLPTIPDAGVDEIANAIKRYPGWRF